MNIKKARGNIVFGIMDTVSGNIEPSTASYLENLPNDHRFLQVPKDYINHWASGHKCDKPGCMDDGSVKCHIPDLMLSPNNADNRFEHFCPEHAYDAGYCSLCGEFWGGIESFEFDNPLFLCENCYEQIENEFYEEDEEDFL